MTSTAKTTVLVTGATGYIGGRLVPRLLLAGYRVRCLARDPRKLDARHWARETDIEIVQGNVADASSLRRAMQGCSAAYYLVHSMMAAGKAYRSHDRQLAEKFSRAAADAGIGRIIYLGGLGETGADLSEHLTSRREVEAALASGGVPVTVFRAAMIIGSGSASFEILRYLVERLPIMLTPRWVKTESQPIAVRNVLHYLVECLRVPETIGRTLDIGGPDIATYRELMDIMSDAMGLRRRVVIGVPVLTPRLSSLWIHLVTPLSHRIARPLAEGLRNRVVCRNDEAARLMPQPLLSTREAIDAALGKMSSRAVETAWSDAGAIPGDPDWAGGRVFVDRRETSVSAPAASVFRAVCRLGGNHGYHGGDWLWRLRGVMDRVIGGPGLRRGRRDPEQLAFGDALDFWRVVRIEQDRVVELRAEMRLPGIATLEFAIEQDAGDANQSTLIQTARFKPKGLLGLTYWYAVVPLHGFVFNAMLLGLKKDAESERTAAVD
ncbi:MAG: SDR family oxidoreductase [Phycisphaerales bacterium]|nr:SDR family oxidoreductase [Phycisphaerales bacterium]MCB9856208.1 SDR family oxidoreductase [Phycisphaerales bacterium]MCB9863353.1 SDR family oxidoreductase [Phycisphaerales bacterium]